MDLREFFDSIFNIEDTIEDLEKSFIRGNFILDGNGVGGQRRPRDLMLKNSSTSAIRRSNNSFNDIFRSYGHDHIDNQRSGSQFMKSKSYTKEFKSNSDGRFEERIIIKDDDGNERIITKQSDGLKTVQREIHKKDDKIVQNKEVISDIGDDVEIVENVFAGEEKSNRTNPPNSWNYWSFIWPFK